MKDGTRTRDRQGHNLELYHLSYLHHRTAGGRPLDGSIGYHRRSTAVISGERRRSSLGKAGVPERGESDKKGAPTGCAGAQVKEGQ